MAFRASSPAAGRSRPARVLITKIGFDGHDRGSRIVAAFLRDAGMEVIYTPPWQSIETMVRIAVQEDIDLIGVSSLATDHLILPDLMAALDRAGLAGVPVIAGGVIPVQEHEGLKRSGVRALFGPGARKDEIVHCALALGNAAKSRKHLPAER